MILSWIIFVQRWSTLFTKCATHKFLLLFRLQIELIEILATCKWFTITVLTVPRLLLSRTWMINYLSVLFLWRWLYERLVGGGTSYHQGICDVAWAHFFLLRYIRKYLWACLQEALTTSTHSFHLNHVKFLLFWRGFLKRNQNFWYTLCLILDLISCFMLLSCLFLATYRLLNCIRFLRLLYIGFRIIVFLFVDLNFIIQSIVML